MEFDLHADNCNVGSGFLATDYLSFLQSQGTEGQNTRPNRLSHLCCAICIRNYCFSENLFLVIF